MDRGDIARWESEMKREVLGEDVGKMVCRSVMWSTVYVSDKC